MSGALIELAAKGEQDAYLTGKPEVSFFHQSYKRHTNFAMSPVKIDVMGTYGANQMVTLKIPNKGDLLGYIWMNLTSTSIDAGQLNDTIFELYIGGQMIDRQDGFYMLLLWQKFLIDSSAKGDASAADYGALNTAYKGGKWLPLHFFFCDSCYLPLVALQYHEVEIRITFGNGVNFSGGKPTFYGNYIVLDTLEREAIVKSNMELLIEQVQRISPIDSSNKKFDLSYFNHPVKCLLWGSNTHTLSFQTSDVQLYLNGTEMFNSTMPNIYFTQVQGYYHSEFGTELLKGATIPDTGSVLKMYSFALKASKHQPCGTCNFSRLDNGALTFGTISNAPSPFYLYAVNFNILRIKDGLGGLMFSN
jgi:hypothetical protein